MATTTVPAASAVLTATLLLLSSSSASASASPPAGTIIPPLPPGADPLWLRYPLVIDRNRLHTYRSLITSAHVSAGATSDAVSLAQLRSAAAELGLGLSGMLGKDIKPTCCSQLDDGAVSGEPLVSIEPEEALGKEGFRIGRSAAGGVTVVAATASGALYGSFRLLSYLQRGEAIPSNFTSTPAMALRIWDLWDVLSGEVTRGYAGRSLIWPMVRKTHDAFCIAISYPK
jgi:alpha-glucuronidase